MIHQRALELIDSLVADGKQQFSFDDAVRRSGRSSSATANLLSRMVARGLLDRVLRGHYVVRQLGELGTDAAAEDVALAVGAAFTERPHRIGYRTALDEHDLVSNPTRTIQVAATRRMRVSKLSNRPLRIILEPESAIDVGAVPLRGSNVSDLERALLDAAARPELVGGPAVLAEAITAAAGKAQPEQLIAYAGRLGWTAALRRIGSLADGLEVEGLERAIEPLREIKGDIALEPGTREGVWRDAKWRVRWPMTPDELRGHAEPGLDEAKHRRGRA